MTKDNEKHHCTAENAMRTLSWIRTRGGLALWQSIDLSDPGKSWTTPALTEDGKPYEKPTWKAASEPYRIITDAADVLVDIPKEVKRFHVAVYTGAQGLKIKVTDGGSRRIRAAVRKAADQYGEAWSEFDYGTQEAVIFVAEKSVPLSEWEAANAARA